MNPSFSAGQRLFFVGLLAATTLFFLWMVRGFLFPVFWAVVFALLLHPLYAWLARRCKNESLAAALAMFGALLLIVIPISWFGTKIAQEALALYRLLAAGGALESLIVPSPILDVLTTFGVDLEEMQASVVSWAQSASAWIFSEALAISSATFNAVLKTLLMLYLLFFFLRDGEKLGRYITHRLPLGDKN